MTPGRLYLIPTPLGGNDPAEVLPQAVLGRACSLRCFVVEELRTARRFLSAYGLRGHIDGLDFHVLNEHTTPAEVEALLRSSTGRTSACSPKPACRPWPTPALHWWPSATATASRSSRSWAPPR